MFEIDEGLPEFVVYWDDENGNRVAYEGVLRGRDPDVSRDLFQNWGPRDEKIKMPRFIGLYDSDKKYHYKVDKQPESLFASGDEVTLYDISFVHDRWLIEAYNKTLRELKRQSLW